MDTKKHNKMENELRNKVFKFYVEDETFYAYSGLNEDEAKKAMLSDNFGFEIEKVEEINESEFDERFIQIYDDNDTTKEPYIATIRELLCNCADMIFTNDPFALD